MALVLVPPAETGCPFPLPPKFGSGLKAGDATHARSGVGKVCYSRAEVSGSAAWACKQVRRWGEGAGKGAWLGFYHSLRWDRGESPPHGRGLHVGPSRRHRGREHLGFVTSSARCGRMGKRAWGGGKLWAAGRQTLSQR